MTHDAGAHGRRHFTAESGAGEPENAPLDFIAVPRFQELHGEAIGFNL